MTQLRASIRISALALLVILAWEGVSRVASAQPTAQLPSLDGEAEQWVTETLARLGLEEKVGQLIVATTPTGFTNITLPPYAEMRNEIQRYHLGGMHAFRGTALSAAFLLRRLQSESSIPLLLTADLEGGAGLIFSGATRFPRAMAMGATHDLDLVFRAARSAAREARLIGVNLSFSPVADVNNNPDNPIINTRSFGEDPQQVALMTSAFVRGLQEGGVLATAKHFPGHGDTATDSHLELAVITADRARLEAVELVPFRAAIASGVAAIMTAHLAVPALDSDASRPATLSPPILTGLLRQDLGFSGLIVTDAMNMYAVSKNYPEGESAVLALEAGADIILYPLSIAKTHVAILQAVRSGRVTRKRLDRSVQRILEAKARLSLNRAFDLPLEELDRDIGSADGQGLAQELMEKAITLVRNEKNYLPLRKRQGASCLVISVFDRFSRADSRGSQLVRALRERGQEVVSAQVDSETSAREIELMIALARKVDFVVLPVFVRFAAFQGSLELGERQTEILTRISSDRTAHSVVAFGSPYLLSSVPTLSTYMAAYDDLPAAEIAAARLLLGEIPFQGKLPISLPGSDHKVGHGLN